MRLPHLEDTPNEIVKEIEPPGYPSASPPVMPYATSSSSGCLPVTAQPAPRDRPYKPYDLTRVVVNLANVGFYFGYKVDPIIKGFNWQGVRKCVEMLRNERHMSVIGVIWQDFKGDDSGESGRMQRHIKMPSDIRKCIMVQETPRLTGKKHKSADDEMTIKIAYELNCPFLDNDNYQDWIEIMNASKYKENRDVGKWLENHQDLLQMRYYFNQNTGAFAILDGNKR